MSMATVVKERIEIVERNKLFERTTSKMDEYFVQELVIHLDSIK